MNSGRMEEFIAFEHTVEALLRRMFPDSHIVRGGSVPSSAQRLDFYVEQSLPNQKRKRIAVETKASRTPLSAHRIPQVAILLRNLIAHGLIDEAIIVSQSGFTQEALEIGKRLGLRLLSLPEFEAIAESTPEAKGRAAEISVDRRPYAFVIMPFDSEFDSIYQNILTAAANANMKCTRMDEILFVGDIVERIVYEIKRADIIIAETTGQNPNVFYELGIAHALEKPVALLVDSHENIPFDIRAKRHIVHRGDAKQLREQLEKLLTNLRGELGL